MGRGRQTHLARRGAIYLVRFRLPVDLVPRFGMADFRRSLKTADPALARRRCSDATVWFQMQMDRCRAMQTLTRKDLEQAAQNFFAHLAEADRHRPRGFDPERLDEAVGYEIEMSRIAIEMIDDELRTNTFAGDTQLTAEQMLGHGPAALPLPVQLRSLSDELAARVSREMLRLRMHRLSEPARRYEPYDALFELERPVGRMLEPLASIAVATGVTVAAAGETFLVRTEARKVGPSHITELRRGLGWLREAVGSDTDLRAVTTEQMKVFRDDLQRLDKTLQGKALPFAKRLTGNPERQIAYATSTRYWRGIQAFFSWAVEDRLIPTSPADVAKIPKPKGIVHRTPPPFSKDEMVALLATPLFTGHLGRKRVKTPGSCIARGGEWWAAVLFMHTGLRAGELSQLGPSDFDFGADIPHLKVREIGETGSKEKSVKNGSSIRDVPLHPRLLELGLKEFVTDRQKRWPGRRVFVEFRLGKNRKSEGATRFWGDYLQKFGFWKEGRSTHVWRHTFVKCLRCNGVAVEDIASIVGHTGLDGIEGAAFGQTKGYGGAYPLERKHTAILKLEYGFDVVQALGGPYDPQCHA